MFRKDELIRLCKVLSADPEMMGVHLSDNGLFADEETKMEIMSLFGIHHTAMHKEFPEFTTNKTVKNQAAIKNKVKGTISESN